MYIYPVIIKTMENRTIYQIIDASDVKRHYQLGIFTTADEAKSKLATYSAFEPVTVNAKDYEVIHIVETRFGWGTPSKVVYNVTRKQFPIINGIGSTWDIVSIEDIEND